MWCWMDSHTGVAAWVQAGGAILAIYVAVGLAYWQGRQALRYQASPGAERVRSIARLLHYWWVLCDRSYVLRKRETGHALVDKLNVNLSEFNTVAARINEYPVVDAPSEAVFRAVIRYRDMCGPLSNFMSPNYEPPPGNEWIEEFDRRIQELKTMEKDLLKEADRLARC